MALLQTSSEVFAALGGSKAESTEDELPISASLLVVQRRLRLSPWLAGLTTAPKL